MKKLLIIFTVLLFINSSKAQTFRPDAIITFKDGTTKEGFIKLKSKGGPVSPKSAYKIIKYKSTKASEKEIYDYTTVEKIQYRNSFGDLIVAEYIKVNKYKKPQLLDLEIHGKMSLYSKYNPNGNGPGIGQGMASGAMNRIFYVKRQDADKAEFYIIYGSIPPKKFKKVVRDYFTNCPAIQEKIKNKELKKKDFRKAVEFYNENCGS